MVKNAGPASNYPIWQVARATSAAPTYFDNMKIGNDVYCDGGFGCNNPAFQAVNEVSEMSGGSEDITLLSIGTGESPISRFAPGKSTQLWHWGKAALGLATNTNDAHDSVLRLSEKGKKFPYYRFNVQDGLSEVKLDECKKARGRVPGTLEKIESLTKEYLNSSVEQKSSTTVRDQLRDIARELVHIRRLRFNTSRWGRFSGGTQYRCAIDYCPSGQQLYFSETEIWHHLTETHGKPEQTNCTPKQNREIQALIKFGKLEYRRQQ